MKGFTREKILFLSSILLIAATLPARAANDCGASLKLFLGSRINEAAPTSLKEINVALMAPSGRALNDLAKGKIKLNYVVDPENRVLFSTDALSISEDRLVVVNSRLEGGSIAKVPVKEAGRVEYDSTTRTYKLVPTFEPIDLSEEELQLIRESASEQGTEVRHSFEGSARAQMMDCKKIYEAQKSGKSFIWDQFLTSNALLTLSIATHNPGRFTDVANYDMLLTDYVTTNELTGIRSFTSRYMMLNNVGYLARLSNRAAVGWGSTKVQEWTSKLIMSDKNGQSSSERAESIAKFNRLYMFPSMLKSDAVDRAILQKLPDVAFDLCMKGSPLRIFASPKMIRFAEGWLSSTIYFTLRDKFTGQK